MVESKKPAPDSGEKPSPAFFPSQTLAVNITEDLAFTSLLLGGEAGTIAQPASGEDRLEGQKVSVASGRIYEVEREVGKGGMGVVFEARDHICKRNVAMKVLLKEGDSPREDVAMFVDEARITAQLEHPNIVPVHDLGVTEGPQITDLAGGASAAGAVVAVGGGRCYEVASRVAEGGMGIVYEASDQVSRRTVAMKVMSGKSGRSKNDLLKFIEEARITALLEHPNIIPVHDLGVTPEQSLFYTMKYVRGINLTDVILGIRHGDEAMIDQYPLSRLLNIFQKVCDAVAFAHSKGVIHRDLKPDNVMIGDFGEVLLMDWGLAQFVENTSAAVDREKKENEGVESEDSLDGLASRVVGTPGFLAPERIRDSRFPGDDRSDIYALGATLYSILTLRPPVADKDLKRLVQRVITGDIVPPVHFNEPDFTRSSKSKLPHCAGGLIPAVLSEIAMKAMAVDPAARYASVKEFQRDIEAFQQGKIWHPVVDEKFDPADFSDRWVVYGGTHELRDGELCIQGGEPQLLIYKGDVAGDVRMEFDCFQDAICPATIGCFLSAIRSSNPKDMPNSGYRLEYGAFDNTVNVISRVEKKILTQPTKHPLVRGKEYHVCVERIGSRLRATVNDEEIFNFVDPDPLSGADRVGIGLIGWRMSTHFRRIRICTLGTPWMSDFLELAERQFQKGNYLVAMALFQEVMESFSDEDRKDRARRGYELAYRREAANQVLQDYRSRLRKAWPKVPFQLRSDNEGLYLEIPPCGVKDLTPLKGFPLTALALAHNEVSDLEPLRGMPLAMLDCIGNPVTSLEPLKGAPLNSLFCEGGRIESLDPVRDMKLSLLNCANNRIASLEPLRGMQLTFLCCWGNRIENLEPVRGMPLTMMICSANRIADLDPLQGMPIVTLICSGNRISSLDPLKGMPLNVLHCGDNRIASLEPLRGMNLTVLGCHANQIASLEPLRGMPLEVVMCGANRLTSLGPLNNAVPRQFNFYCDTFSTHDLEWLKEQWSRDFRLASYVRNLDVLLALRKNDKDRLLQMAATWNGHRYLFIPQFMTWEEARTFCEKLGGHLLTVTSKEENEFVHSLFPFGCWFWMGLNTTEHGQEWVTGEPFEYANFSDRMQERWLGPKVFIGQWSLDGVPNAHNCFMIEWDT